MCWAFDPRSSVPVLEEWTRKGHPDERETIVNKLKALKRGEINSWEGEYRFQPSGWRLGHRAEPRLPAQRRRRKSNPDRRRVDGYRTQKTCAGTGSPSPDRKGNRQRVLIFDRESGKTTWVNEGFTRLTGYSLRDIYGKHRRNSFYGPETDLKNHGLPAGAEAKRTALCSRRADLYQDRGKKWHYINGQPMRDENGELTKYFVLSTDVGSCRLEDERLNFKINQQKEISRAIIHGRESERNELGRNCTTTSTRYFLPSISLSSRWNTMTTAGRSFRDCRSNLQDAIHEIRQLSHRMVTPRFSEISMQDIPVQPRCQVCRPPGHPARHL